MAFGYSGDSKNNNKLIKYIDNSVTYCKKNAYIIGQFFFTACLFVPVHYFFFPLINSKNIRPTIGIIILVGLIVSCVVKQKSDLQLLLDENKKLIKYQENYKALNEDMTTFQQKQQEIYSTLIQAWLQAILYGLSIDKPNYRVTIFNTFQDNEKNISFRFLARYSNNKLYSTPHVLNFKMDNGIISQTWKQGPTIDIKECPIYEQNQDAYIEYIHQTYQLTKDRIESLTMKSDQYIGLRVSDTPNGIKGIIVFESIAENNKRGLDEVHVQNIKNFCQENAFQLDFMLDLGLSAQSMIQSREQQLEKEAVNKTELSLIQNKIGGKNE